MLKNIDFVLRSLTLLIINLLTLFIYTNAQRVGVVLSGGGALGIAHIGVLKALEENNIPIDYIAGTSMGSIIGAMYASGMSIAEMEQIVLSDEFNNWVTGTIDQEYTFYFKKPEPNASWVSIKLNIDSSIKSSIPTNLVSPYVIDYRLMQFLGPSAAVANYNFDSLFVPFRCVAADIENKLPVVFRSGNLASAVRASATYPLYINPIRIDGVLLYDGGLYNNFPSDVLYKDFHPDVIIGSNVAGTNTAPPKDDDIISHLKNMIMTRTNYDPLCENMIIINPKVNVSVFDFSKNAESIQIGFDATMKKLDSIKYFVERRVSSEELAERRARFRERIKPLEFNKVHITGLKKSQVNYVKRSLSISQDSVFTSDDFTFLYFRLLGDEKIKTIYPTVILDKESGKYDLYLDTKADQSLEVQFGGNFSSRPINMAFIGLKYKRLWNTALSVTANSYFGRLYSSVYLNGRMDFPSKTPYYVDFEYGRNRFDYFNSNTSFFELVRPPFVILIENYLRANIGLPAGNQSKVILSTTLGGMDNEYYQGSNFANSDTSDRTNFNFFSTRVFYELNNLNRKQFATEGTFLRLSTTLYSGRESHTPGSTSPTKEFFQRNREWITFKAEWIQFFLRKKRYNVGLSGEFVYSTMPFFNNFYSTLIMAPFYEPIPESRALFMPGYRTNEYTAAGLSLIYFLRKNIDIRAEGYIFQPWRTLNLEKTNNTTFYGDWFAERSFIGSTSLVFNTPIGSASFSLNYYSNHTRNWSFLFNFGYIIFNKRAL